LANLYAEDAILVAPGAPRAEGRAAIEALFTEMFTEVKFGATDIGIDNMGVSESGDVAYIVGSYSSPIINADGTTFDDAGTYVAVLKDVNGEWLLAVDTWRSEMAAADTE
jgi:ketosteroid isomerase-like protein